MTTINFVGQTFASWLRWPEFGLRYIMIYRCLYIYINIMFTKITSSNFTTAFSLKSHRSSAKLKMCFLHSRWSMSKKNDTRRKQKGACAVMSLFHLNTPGAPTHPIVKGFRYLNWKYLPYIRPIFSGLNFREYRNKTESYMVRYLHFRILKSPLK